MTRRDESGVLRLHVPHCRLGGMSGDHECRSFTGVCFACGDGARVYEAPVTVPCLAAARMSEHQL